MQFLRLLNDMNLGLTAGTGGSVAYEPPKPSDGGDGGGAVAADASDGEQPAVVAEIVELPESGGDDDSVAGGGPRGRGGQQNINNCVDELLVQGSLVNNFDDLDDCINQTGRWAPDTSTVTSTEPSATPTSGGGPSARFTFVTPMSFLSSLAGVDDPLGEYYGRSSDPYGWEIPEAGVPRGADGLPDITQLPYYKRLESLLPNAPADADDEEVSASISSVLVTPEMLEDGVDDPLSNVTPWSNMTARPELPYALDGTANDLVTVVNFAQTELPKHPEVAAMIAAIPLVAAAAPLVAGGQLLASVGSWGVAQTGAVGAGTLAAGQQAWSSANSQMDRLAVHAAQAFTRYFGQAAQAVRAFIQN